MEQLPKTFEIAEIFLQKKKTFSFSLRDAVAKA